MELKGTHIFLAEGFFNPVENHSLELDDICQYYSKYILCDLFKYYSSATDILYHTCCIFLCSTTGRGREISARSPDNFESCRNI